MRLAETAGLHELLEKPLSVESSNLAAKSASIVAGMLAGADSIDGLDILRHGAMGRRLGGVRGPVDAGHRASFAGIDEAGWTPITYPNAIRDDEKTRWISGADVTETAVTVFTSRRKAEHVTCHMVVRRVKRLNPAADAGEEELSAAHCHHAFVTNSTLTTVEADARHRDRAIVEQAIVESKDGPLAHLPSGRYTANATWLALAVIAFNLARAAGATASPRHARARWATLRTLLFNLPTRVVSSGRRLSLHLPTGWSWESAARRLFEIASSPPVATARPSAQQGTTGNSSGMPGRPAAHVCLQKIARPKLAGRRIRIRDDGSGIRGTDRSDLAARRPLSHR
ncbi:transposase [Rhodococcus ruber]|uniref:transposase n=1 Tax=Rhodococcus TaxID=1827 RepID=UPI00029A449B